MLNVSTVIDARRGLFEASITEGDSLNLDATIIIPKVTEPRRTLLMQMITTVLMAH